MTRRQRTLEPGQTEDSETPFESLVTEAPIPEIKWEEGEPPAVKADGRQTVDIRRISTALALVQGEVENAKKSRENAHFKTKYADLVEITDACRASLSRHLIAWIQVPVIGETDCYLETTLIHGPSGQFIKGDYPIPPGVRGDSQKLVAAITYGRRTSLATMVGVASEADDDDGEAVHDRTGQQEGEQQQRQPVKSQNTLKAEQWADWAATKKIPNLATKDDLVAWEEKNSSDIAALTKLAPEHHTKLKQALTDAAARLGLGRQTDG